MKRDILLREVKTVTNKNLLEIEGKISIKRIGTKGWAFSSLFFLTIYANMERKDPDKSITMQLSPLGVLSVKEAILELIEKSELTLSDLSIFSGGASTTKKLQVARDNSLYYLNFFEGSRKISLALTRYEARGLLDILDKAVTKIYNTEDNYRQKAQQKRENR